MERPGPPARELRRVARPARDPRPERGLRVGPAALPPQAQPRGRILDGKRERGARGARPAGGTPRGVEASGPAAALAQRVQPVVADVQAQRAPCAIGARRSLENAVAGTAPEEERRGTGTTADRNLVRVDLRLDDGRSDQLGAEPCREPDA